MGVVIFLGALIVLLNREEPVQSSDEGPTREPAASIGAADGPTASSGSREEVAGVPPSRIEPRVKLVSDQNAPAADVVKGHEKFFGPEPEVRITFGADGAPKTILRTRGTLIGKKGQIHYEMYSPKYYWPDHACDLLEIKDPAERARLLALWNTHEDRVAEVRAELSALAVEMHNKGYPLDKYGEVHVFKARRDEIEASASRLKLEFVRSAVVLDREEAALRNLTSRFGQNDFWGEGFRD